MFEDAHYVGDQCEGGHSDMAGKQAVPEVEVKCTTCKNKWWVGPNEVPKGEVPECPKCHSFGISTGKSRLSTER